tara:strand:- start:184 stop:501 length:318 start_codon:yes stop_codon:yes gene_type:complete
MKKSEIITELEKLKKSYEKSFDFHRAVVEKNALCLLIERLNLLPPGIGWTDAEVEEVRSLYKADIENPGSYTNRIIDLSNLGKADTYWEAHRDIDYLLADIKEGE